MAKRQRGAKGGESEAPAGVRFVGGGYFPGIPARDLAADEWAALDPVQRTALVASGLYVVDEPEQAPAEDEVIE